MAANVRDVMTSDPVVVDAAASLTQAAELMRTHNIGDVLVMDNGRIDGILTDRDIVVRAVADGQQPDALPCGACCTGHPQMVDADDSLNDAMELMRQHAVRRLPVVEGDELIGVVSIGDLALSDDHETPLADISAAAPNV
jgi:CBS domain-containing protein